MYVTRPILSPNFISQYFGDKFSSRTGSLFAEKIGWWNRPILSFVCDRLNNQQSAEIQRITSINLRISFFKLFAKHPHCLVHCARRHVVITHLWLSRPRQRLLPQLIPYIVDDKRLGVGSAHRTPPALSARSFIQPRLSDASHVKRQFLSLSIRMLWENGAQDFVAFHRSVRNKQAYTTNKRVTRHILGLMLRLYSKYMQ